MCIRDRPYEERVRTEKTDYTMLPMGKWESKSAHVVFYNNLTVTIV